MTNQSGWTLRQGWGGLLFATCCLLLMAGGCAKPAPTSVVERKDTWATPLVEVEGFENLFRVSPALYRTEQPTKTGLERLRDRLPLEPGAKPVRTVISLRAVHDKDGDVLEGAEEVDYVRIKFNTWHPETEDVVQFLNIVTTPERQPVLVHCQHGADRTGMMVAVYRVIVEDWSREDALEEMTKGGYGYHSMWKDIQEFVKELDVAALKAEVEKLQRGE